MTKRLKLAQHLVQWLGILVMVVPRASHAYIDPGAGSSVVQVVIAALATGSYLLKVYWRQIKRAVSRSYQWLRRRSQNGD